MAKADEIIELGKFTPTKTVVPWGKAANPFAIYFVYCPNKFIIVKGMSEDVKKYVEENFPRAVYRYTYWKDGESRGYWASTTTIYFTPVDVGKRQKYQIWIQTGNSNETFKKFLTVRRIPNKWLDIYNLAVPKRRED